MFNFRERPVQRGISGRGMPVCPELVPFISDDNHWPNVGAGSPAPIGRWFDGRYAGLKTSAHCYWRPRRLVIRGGSYWTGHRHAADDEPTRLEFGQDDVEDGGGERGTIGELAQRTLDLQTVLRWRQLICGAKRYVTESQSSGGDPAEWRVGMSGIDDGGGTVRYLGGDARDNCWYPFKVNVSSYTQWSGFGFTVTSSPTPTDEQSLWSPCGICEFMKETVTASDGTLVTRGCDFLLYKFVGDDERPGDEQTVDVKVIIDYTPWDFIPLNGDPQLDADLTRA